MNTNKDNIIYKNQIIRLISFTILESYYKEYPNLKLKLATVSHVEKKMAIKLHNLPKYLKTIFFLLTVACFFLLFFKFFKISNFSFEKRCNYINTLKSISFGPLKNFYLFIQKFTVLYLMQWYHENKQ